MATLISALAWVKRGASAETPKRYEIDEQELARVSELAREQVEDAKLDLEEVGELMEGMGVGADEDDHEEDWEEYEKSDEDEKSDQMELDEQVVQKRDKEDLSEYKLDDYDKESTKKSGIFSNIKGLTYYKDNEDDPYITLKDEDEVENDELKVYGTDNLIVSAKTEDEISQLEIHVYDESSDSLYVHHDLMLPSLPLCLEWLDFPPSSTVDQPSQPGNFVAVGTFEPEIEIWSLDMVESLFPDALLGRPDVTKAHIPTPLGTGKKKKKKTKAREANAEYHVDAVLSLSWNRTHRNLLASASADKTVKLWDLSREPTSGAIRSFNVHKDKVQAVQWNPVESTVLLTGSYDRTVRTFDTRAPDAGVGAILGADVEAIRWDPWEPHCFYVALENGIVLNFDARTLPSDLNSPSPSRFTLSAHDGAVSAMDVNPHIKGCLVTGGTDKLVKVWNITENGGKRDITMVTSRDLGVGKVFSASWSPDDVLTLAAGGSKGMLQIWDVSTNAGARKTMAGKVKEAGRALREKTGDGVIGVVSDNEDDSEEDE